MGGLICVGVVLSPWAFGTTQPWSIWTMNWVGYVLGVLFLVQLAFGDRRRRSVRGLALGLLTFLLLTYVLLSAWNASAHYVATESRLVDRPHFSWLPHSYDAPATWQAFWNYLALAGSFWAIYTWLSRKDDEGRGRISPRLRVLVWLVTVNAAMLSLEGIIQRTSGTPNLLWIQPTHDNKDASAQFGPYAYRSNAAQYLNLVWPLALGFWWWLQRNAEMRGRGRGSRHLLLPCVIIIAAGALFSLSRAGAGVAALLLMAACLLLGTRRRVSWPTRAAAITLGVGTLAAGWFISWSTLGKRFADTARDPMVGRAETYALAEKMAEDYPWFGTGPGTFENLFQVYRANPEQYWPAQLHNDWLEFRITFGWVGFALLLAAVAVSCLSWALPGGVPRCGAFLALTTLALAGCLLHARVDFPFQIYSINFLFILFAAMLFGSSRAGERSSRSSGA